MYSSLAVAVQVNAQNAHGGHDPGGLSADCFKEVLCL